MPLPIKRAAGLGFSLGQSTWNSTPSNPACICAVTSQSATNQASLHKQLWSQQLLPRLATWAIAILKAHAQV